MSRGHCEVAGAVARGFSYVIDVGKLRVAENEVSARNSRNIRA